MKTMQSMEEFYSAIGVHITLDRPVKRQAKVAAIVKTQARALGATLKKEWFSYSYMTIAAGYILLRMLF